jgi:DNA-binding Lrp family transcriptional regulator
VADHERPDLDIPDAGGPDPGVVDRVAGGSEQVRAVRQLQRFLASDDEAFIELKFAGTASIEEISSSVERLPQVRALFMTAGDPDALVWLGVEDLSHLKRIVNELRRNKRITGTRRCSQEPHRSA